MTPTSAGKLEPRNPAHAPAEVCPHSGNDCRKDQEVRRSTWHATRVIRVNASLSRTYQPNVVDEIVSLGKVTIAAGAVASRVEGPAAHSAWHGQGQAAWNVSSVPICDRDRIGLPTWRRVRSGDEAILAWGRLDELKWECRQQ